MRLAFVTALIPVARPDTGFEIANAAILAALRAAGHDITAIGYLRPGDEPADPSGSVVVDRLPIENAAVGPGRKLAWLAGAFRLGLPVACAKLRLAGGLVEAVQATGPFDALIINSVLPWGAFPELATIAPRILVAHNIEHVSAAQSAEHAQNPVTRLLYRREARLLAALERDAFATARFVWTLAEEDRLALGPDAAARAAVLPLAGAPGDAAPPAEASRPFTHDVGLIGTWTWAPNRIGLDWFLEQVCPLLPAGTTVAVAGRLPDGIAAPPNVTLVGRVPNADAFLAGCRVVALSSRAGTGVQLKTIEALRLGLPAVATPLSCRGFTAMPENVTVADTPASFASALVASVRRVREGNPMRLDGHAFLASERAALSAAIARGLASVRG